jgi:hypothetical protein
MWRKGRPVVETFDPDEWLYFRVSPQNVVNGQLSSAVVDMPAQSVNRSKFSEPNWALIPPPDKPESAYAGFHVFGVQAKNVPTGTKSGPSWWYGVEHLPEDYNYSHSEIRATEDGSSFSDDKEPPRSSRKEFRATIFHHCKPFTD